MVQANPYRRTSVTPEKFSAFTRLEANVKEKIQVGLGPCTLILGKNRAYKTSILDAFRLAVTGKHPAGHYPSELLELAHDPTVGLSVSLQAPGLFADFELPVEGGKAKEPQWDFDGELKSLLTEEAKANIIPPDSVGEILNFGAAKAREAVLRRFGPKGQTIRQPLGLDEGQLALWHEGVLASQDECGKDSTAATIYAGVSAWMRSAVRTKGAEANAFDERVTKAKRALTEDAAGGENIENLKKQLADAQAWERTALDRQRLKQYEAELAPAKAKLEELEKQKATAAEAWKHRSAELQKQIALEQRAIVAAQEGLAKQHQGLFFGERLVETFQKEMANSADTHKARCAFCWTEGVDLHPRHDNFAERVEVRKKSITALDEDLRKKMVNLNNLVIADATETEAARSAAFQITDTIGTLRTQVATNEARSQEIERRLTSPYAGPPSAELAAIVQRIETATRARGALEEDAGRLRKLRRQIEDAKILGKEAIQLAEASLRMAGDSAAAAITKYMPAGLKCEVRITDTQWEWCVVGLDGKTHRRHVASGSEWMALQLAFPQAWTEGSPLRVALYDDRDLGTFDKEVLLRFLAALKGAVDRGDLTQAIVVWNRPEEFRGVELPGWTIIRRDPQITI